MKKRKPYVIFAVLTVMVFLVGACTQNAPVQTQSSVEKASSMPLSTPTSTTEATQSSETQQSGFINANVLGNVTEDTKAELKDDFYTFINKDWICQSQIATGEKSVSSSADRQKEVQKEIEAILKDTSLTSNEAKLVQQIYNDFLDIKTRNELGVQPIMKYLEKIMQISSLNELTQYLTTDNQNKLVNISVETNISDSTKYCVMFGSGYLSLGDADEYKNMSDFGKTKKAALDELNKKALMRVGYSEEEAINIWNKAYDFETELAQKTMGRSDTYKADYYEKINNPFTLEQINEISPDFPMAKTLEDVKCDKSNIILLSDIEWLKQLNSMYKEENLEAIKACLLIANIDKYSAVLDEDFVKINTEYKNATKGTVGELPLEKQAYNYVNDILKEAIGKLYVEEYFSEETKKDVENIIGEAMNVFKNRMQNNQWIGEATKEKALEKLNTIRVNVGYPNKWKDFSTLKLKSVKEGGNLVENHKAILDFLFSKDVEKINTTVDKNAGDALSNPQVVNAYYSVSDNSINIPAGILGGVFYDVNGTQASQMGGIGIIIGHEITHAFDTSGSQFDKDGNLKNWWTQEDADAFKALTDDVANYFGSFEALPGKNVNGELVVTEATADLGGVSCMLEIAKSIPNFDYEDFFNSYATSWQAKMTKEDVEERLLTDSHPPIYLRVNAILQQFNEFYDTYKINEKDGMYLAPNKRLTVW